MYGMHRDASMMAGMFIWVWNIFYYMYIRSSCTCVQVWGKTGAKLYGAKSGADYVDNPKRFRVFCEACIEAVRSLPFGPGEDCVFVANDWHTAMIPILLKVRSGDDDYACLNYPDVLFARFGICRPICALTSWIASRDPACCARACASRPL